MCIHTHVYTYMFICPCTCKTGGGGKGRRGSGPGPGPGLGRARMLSCNVSVWQKSGCRTAWIYGKWKVENGVFFFKTTFQNFKKMKNVNSTQFKMTKKCICKFSLSTKKGRFSACMCSSEACTKKHEYWHFCCKRRFGEFMGMGRAYIYIYVHIHIYIYTHVYMHGYTYVYNYTCMWSEKRWKGIMGRGIWEKHAFLI